MPRPKILDILAGAAQGYSQGVQSDIPEAGLASGFIGGMDTAKKMGLERRKQAAIQAILSAPPEKRGEVAMAFLAQEEPGQYAKGLMDRETATQESRIKEILERAKEDRAFDRRKELITFALNARGGGGNGKPPPGYRWKGNDLEPIPGGPAANKLGKEADKAAKMNDAAVNQADLIISKVDQALGKVGKTSAGIGGSVFGAIPGTTARDLASDLETIKANLGFAELQAMRQASPTGGALGAIAVQELKALQSTVASLDQEQSPAQLAQRLREIKGHYQRWRATVQAAGQETETPAPLQQDDTFDDLRSLGLVD